MPKIPLYNEGRGSGVALAAGQLSPRASMQAFTAPATASAQFFDGLSKVAAEFGQREKSRETDRIYAEELVRLREEATTFNLENRDTEIGAYETNWKDFQDAAENRIRGYGNLTKSQSQEIINKLAPDFATFGISGKQEAYKRGQSVSSAAFQSIANNRIETISSLPIGHPDRVAEKDKFKAELDKAIIDGLNIGGYTEPFFDNEVEKITITKQLNATSTLKGISDVQDLMSVSSNLTSEDIDALRTDIETARTRVRANVVSTLTSTLTLDDVGTRVTSVAQIDAREKALLDGSVFEGRPQMQAMLNDLDEVGKKQFLDEVNKKASDMRQQLNFRQGQEDRRVKRNNEEIYTDLTDRILRQESDAPSVDDINNAAFEGAEGERLREGLKGLLGRSLSADMLTDTSPKTYISTKTLIHTKAIKSITQPFTLPHEAGKQGFAQSVSLQEGKSLIDRAGATDGYNFDDYTELADLILDMEKATQSKQSAMKVVQENAFNDFLRGNEQRIKGYSGLQKLDLSTDQRFYDFSMYMRRQYQKQLEEGKDYIDLLDPRSPDYILKEPQKFALSYREQLKLIGSQMKSETPELSAIAPPQRRQGESPEQFLAREQAYFASEDWPLYLSLRPQETE